MVEPGEPTEAWGASRHESDDAHRYMHPCPFHLERPYASGMDVGERLWGICVASAMCVWRVVHAGVHDLRV